MVLTAYTAFRAFRDPNASPGGPAAQAQAAMMNNILLESVCISLRPGSMVKAFGLPKPSPESDQPHEHPDDQQWCR
jgi:hypothetical protein